jgi:hypothetical protein
MISDAKIIKLVTIYIIISDNEATKVLAILHAQCLEWLETFVLTMEPNETPAKIHLRNGQRVVVAISHLQSIQNLPFNDMGLDVSRCQYFSSMVGLKELTGKIRKEYYEVRLCLR